MHASERQIESIYNEHFATLAEMAVDRFKLSEADAAEVAHDILLASILQRPRIVDMKAWLTGALTAVALKRAQEGA